MSEEEFYNDECPAQCSTEHDVPDGGYYSDVTEFTCPETGERYVWCDPCGGWIEGRNRWGRIYVERVNDEWMCDRCREDWSTCDDCGDWCHIYNLNSNDDGESFCDYCYENNHPKGTPIGESVTICRTCNTGNVHLDELSGEFLCDHRAQARIAARVPVRTTRLLSTAVAA